MLYENTQPSKEQKQAGFVDNNECEKQIPMTVFSSADKREGALASAETTDDECDTDCESFGPTDLLRFAWQIARGMVRKILFIN